MKYSSASCWLFSEGQTGGRTDGHIGDASQGPGQRSSLGLTQGQGLPQVGDVVEALEFRHPAAQQEGEEVDEEAGVLADGQVGFVAHLLEPGAQSTSSAGRTGEPALVSAAWDSDRWTGSASFLMESLI